MSDRLTERADIVRRLREADQWLAGVSLSTRQPRGMANSQDDRRDIRLAVKAAADALAQPCAGCAAFREALVNVRERLDGGLRCVEGDEPRFKCEVVSALNAALAQSQPDRVKP